jgi:hypothetical protein
MNQCATGQDLVRIAPMDTKHRLGARAQREALQHMTIAAETTDRDVRRSHLLLAAECLERAIRLLEGDTRVFEIAA